MKWFADLSLQKKTGLLVVSALAVGLGLFSWLGLRAVSESTERVLEQRLTIARIVARQMDETLAHAMSHVVAVTKRRDRLPTDLEFAAMADSLRAISGESNVPVGDVLLLDRDGRVLQAENGKAAPAGWDLAAYPEVQRALKTGIPAISNLVTTSAKGETLVLAIAPILDGKGEVAGLIAGSIDIDRLGIHTFVQTVKTGDTGYIEIVDGNGAVLVRTEPGLAPRPDEMSDHPGRFAELISRGKTTVGTCHRCHGDDEGLQRRRDVLAFAPLSTAPWGVAIRQAEEEALAPTRQLETRLFLLGMTVLFLTSFLLWTMMQGIVRPVKMLTAAARRVAAGDLRAAVPLGKRDEVGQLSGAFHSMTRELAKSRDELVSRNEELSVLNSMAATVSQSLDIGDVLEGALRKVIEITRANTGCVFLADSATGGLRMMKCVGPSGVFRCQNSVSGAAGCACHRVMRSGEALMVNDVSQCPMLGDPALKPENIGYFVIVPLKSKNRTLGVMNICSSTRHSFTQSDFKLLGSVGYHVGLAIENSVLFEEVRHKEQLRGQLLGRLINAHEEERKRIARELHDETIQTLTLLSRHLDSMREKNPSLPASTAEDIERARDMAGRAVKELRDSARTLRPPVLDDLGIVPCIRRLLVDSSERMVVSGKFSLVGSERRLPPDIEVGMFRIAQEALWNVERHSRATEMAASIVFAEHDVTLEVRDNGVGFGAPAAVADLPATGQLGLVGMHERAQFMRAELQIDSAPGEGTVVTLSVPVLTGSPGGSEDAK